MPSSSTWFGGALSSGARMSSSSAGGADHWSIAVNGSDLVLEREGRKVEVLGAVAAGRLPFERTADASCWRFAIAGADRLEWLGDRVVLGQRTWSVPVDRVVRIEP